MTTTPDVDPAPVVTVRASPRFVSNQPVPSVEVVPPFAAYFNAGKIACPRRRPWS
jgi:hypothetical protein